ncbi:putative methyltransferase domain protein [Burkholderia pseudomallei]|nr:putative methyltransferase domain protein [Burkholderia pseudomallei]
MTHTFPRYDDAAAFEVATNLFVYPAMLIAHRLGLFERLGEGPRTLDEIGAALGLARRPAEALVNASAALGFVRRDGARSPASKPRCGAMRRTCTGRRTSSIRIGGMRRSACASRARCRA